MTEYKESNDFIHNVTEARADACIVGFTNCRKKVVKYFLVLDLSKILAPKEEEEEEEEESAKQDATRAD